MFHSNVDNGKPSRFDTTGSASPLPDSVDIRSPTPSLFVDLDEHSGLPQLEFFFSLKMHRALREPHRISVENRHCLSHLEGHRPIPDTYNV